MSKHPKLVSVQVRNGNIQKALKIFKRRIEESGHLQLLRKTTIHQTNYCKKKTKTSSQSTK